MAVFPARSTKSNRFPRHLPLVNIPCGVDVFFAFRDVAVCIGIGIGFAKLPVVFADKLVEAVIHIRVCVCAVTCGQDIADRVVGVGVSARGGLDGLHKGCGFV